MEEEGPHGPKHGPGPPDADQNPVKQAGSGMHVALGDVFLGGDASIVLCECIDTGRKNR